MPLKRILTLLVVALMASPALAQQNNGGGQGGQGGRQGQGGPGGGRGNAQQFRQQFEQRLKESLGCTDDEWKILQPKIQAVQTAQRAGFSGGRGLFGGRGGGGRRGGGGGNGGAGPDVQPSLAQQKAQELQQVLESKDAKPEDIKAKLTALREARASAKADLAKAQEDLRELLTARQEAVMVMYGMLE